MGRSRWAEIDEYHYNLFNRVSQPTRRLPGSGRMFYLAIQPGRKMMTRFPVEYNCNFLNRVITYLKIGPCTTPSLTGLREWSGRIFHIDIQPGRKVMTRFPVE